MVVAGLVAPMLSVVPSPRVTVELASALLFVMAMVPCSSETALKAFGPVLDRVSVPLPDLVSGPLVVIDPLPEKVWFPAALTSTDPALIAVVTLTAGENEPLSSKNTRSLGSKSVAMPLTR